MEYRDPESVERAVLELRDTDLDGRRIYVRKVEEDIFSLWLYVCVYTNSKNHKRL